ncbi:hypothetical protein RM555_26915 [Micromonospora sp. DSM 115977]|uniref:Uncharacterized protein n=1 Tax=Micromonospora reichwaldensis TaxID=3075516 RepID=A0ABU2X360_9ACTN|nr:hypothetical protein [Micromonospora sp. DSM 115977]MDT0532635.1 hypothetical protein [Micromonospora sp. DSM 115977]
MTAPEPTTGPARTPGLPQPMLTPGAGAAFYDGPAFDPADVVAQLPPRPQTGTYHDPGDFRDPAEPIAPPSGVEVPADLAAALTEYDAARAAWVAAVDAVDEHRDEARASRAAREKAIRDAGQAAARGAKRPAIPSATSEADEEAEVRIRSAVVEARRREASDAARKADRLTMTYAAGWAAEVVARFGPALDEATAATQAAYTAAQRAEGILNQAAHWRALALAAELEAKGVRVSEHQRGRLLGDLLDASRTHHYRTAEGQHRAPTQLLNTVHEAIGTLRGCNPGAVPHPDAVMIPGDVAEAREVWWALYDKASPETQRAYRERHPRSFPPR